MNDHPSFLVQFDPGAWTPTVFLTGQTDIETERLRELADQVLKAVYETEDVED